MTLFDGMEDHLPVYAGRHIAFLDILGFSDLVTRGSVLDAGGPLASIQSLLKRASNQLAIDPGPEWRGYWFSDSIIITGPPNLCGLRTVLAQAHGVYGTLIARQRLLRGGVVCGEVFEEHGLLFGPGLVEAHELESKVAIYPRLVVSESLYERNRETLIAHAAPQMCFRLRRDFDGAPFVEPLHTVPRTTDRTRWWADFRATATQGLQGAAGDTHIALKYRWMISRLEESAQDDSS